MDSTERAALAAQTFTVDEAGDWSPEYHFVVGVTFHADGSFTLAMQDCDDVGFGEHVTVFDHAMQEWREPVGEAERAMNEEAGGILARALQESMTA